MCKSAEISRFTPIKYNYINIHTAFNSNLLLVKESNIAMENICISYLSLLYTFVINRISNVAIWKPEFLVLLSSKFS